VVRGKKNFELKAVRADEVFETSKKTVLTGVSFSEYDPDTGELLSLGKADSAIYHMDTKDAEFSGSVRLESKKQTRSFKASTSDGSTRRRDSRVAWTGR